MSERDDPKPGESGERPRPGHRADDAPTAGNPPPRPSSGIPARPGSGADPGSAQFFTPADAGPRPERIGPYRIIREIGDGGMGVVYLALREDEAFQRRVAIKVVKRGMDTDEVLRRFNLERQVLAALNHPNIARLIDGGATDDGRPYFVMEYVEGTPITDHCDAHRLTVDERLVLFRSVCAAVHYAHQNLVVHRDLKPGNILVTADGVPKLLDFGIAKLLNPALAARLIDPTGTELRLMTPEYASPEQARGDPITTASDVYTLGVLLYELLTGHRPYRLKSRIQQDVVRAICEEEPERPSTAVSRIEEVAQPTTGRTGPKPTTRTITPEDVGKARESHPDRLKRRLEGDLDNIVLMAMRKEPQRRYAGARDLAEDIGRHLSNHPVEARPDSPVYRAGKFVRRNRGGVTAAALVALALTTGLGVSLWQEEVARKERGRANEAARLALEAKSRADQAAEDARRQQERAERALHAASSLADLMEGFSRSLEAFQSSTKRREQLAEQTLAALQVLEGDAATSPVVRRAVARAYIRLGDLQGGIRGPGGGRSDAALQSYQRGLALLKESDAAALSASDRLALASALSRVGNAREASDVGAALESYTEALAIVQALNDSGERGPESRRALASAMIETGDVFAKMKRYPDADALFERSLSLRRALAAESGDDSSARRDLFVGCDRMIGVLERAGRLPEALALSHESNELRAQNLQNEPDPRRRMIRDLMVGQWKEAAILSAMGSAEEARAVLERAALTVEGLVKDDPSDARSVRDLATACEKLGDACADLKDRAGAAAAFTRMREAADKMAAIGHTSAIQFQASAAARLGNVRLGAGDAKGALEAYQASLDLYVKKASEDTANLDWQRNVILVRGKLGDARLAMGDAAGCEAAYAQALGGLAELATKGKDKSQYRSEEASTRMRRAVVLLELGRGADAKGEASAAVALLDGKDGSNPAASDDRETLASALAALTLARLAAGENDASIPLAERAATLSSRQDAFVLRALAGARFAAGDAPGAVQIANEALALVKDAPEGSPDARERARLAADLRRFQTP